MLKKKLFPTMPISQEIYFLLTQARSENLEKIALDIALIKADQESLLYQVLHRSA
ncbi:hypothetical protein NIES4072_65970 [Nostoc commune NIES-4072]|uniref:Uncharacterized protein n=1 Tax=Nostoc commune NIES-4072 TaxID=2005467 RepID=A0A2R5FX82_NOSCO|nr:hypothetical protein NIES4070_66420 [Nostoc commune HK-02]GBG22885.1 hypothetical protein NIES4072_65970 [Nostoc commune NIES-4072]